MLIPFCSILVFGIAIRLSIWWGYGADLVPDVLPAELWLADCAGIMSDIPFVLGWDHTRPPLFAIRQIAKCALWPVMHPAHVDLLVVSAADVMAAAVAYLTFRRITHDIRIAIGIALLWTICLVSWEYYRLSSIHNHLNIAIMMFVANAAVRRYQDTNWGNDLVFAVASAILVMSYGPSLVLVPILAFVVLPMELGFLRRAAHTSIALSLPIAVFLSIGLKNYGAFGTFSTSTYLSLNMGQYGIISLGYDKSEEKLSRYLPNLEGSAWWYWCFDARNRDRSRPNSALFALQGKCVSYDEPKSVLRGLKAAHELNDLAFKKTLQLDLETAASKPWALRITGRGMASRTEVLFNETSKRLYVEVLKGDPMGIVRTFFMANRSFIWGPLMFDGVHHEPHQARAPTIINWVSTGFGLLLVGVGVIGGAILMMVVGMNVAASSGWNERAKFRRVDDRAIMIAGFCLAFFITATLMNGVSCCENGRQFQNLSIIPLMAIVYFLDNLVGWARHRPLQSQGTR